MADPLSMVGGIAAVLQIAQAFTHLTSELRVGIRTVRYAPQEIRHFHLDLTNFSLSLRMFHEQSKSCLEDLEGTSEQEIRKRHIAGLIRECRGVETGFQELLSRFFVGSSRFPNAFDAFDRVRWYFRKSLVAGLKLSFESAKSSVTLFLTLHLCEALVRKISELQRALQEVPRDLEHQLRSLKKQFKEQLKINKDARRRLIEHVKTVPDTPLVPDPVSIIDDIRAVEHYVTKTLRNEHRRIEDPSLLTRRQTQPSRSRSTSRNSRLASRGSRSPRPLPPGPSGIGIPLAEASVYTEERQTDAGSMIHPAGLPHNSSGSIEEVIEVPNFTEERMPPSVSSLNLQEPTVLQHVLNIAEQETVGPIIHDDGNELRERYGVWRVGAPELRPRFTRSDQSVTESARSMSRSKDREGSTRSRRPTRKHNVRTERHHTPETTADPGVFKAVPPFRDDDWKGKRR